MLKQYYELAKPGIVYGNLLTTIAAYLYASRWNGSWTVFLATVFGLGLVIASACVFNNYIDRDIDAKMERTKDRALVSGAIGGVSALIFGTVLGIIGFLLLLAYVNVLSAVVAAAGFLVYVFAYTFSKRVTPWATEIGSIAGAVPIVVGYTAVTGQLTWVALILFLILALWQMPHFYAIAMRRGREYAAAGIPALPLQSGTYDTKLRTLLYIFAFAIAAAGLTFFGFAGYAYLVVVELASLVWFWQATQGFGAENEEAWARRLFFASLWVLFAFSVMLALSPFLS